MQDIYSAEEFALCCRLRGVAPRKVVDEYIKDNQEQGVDFFVEADFEVVYELNEMRESRSKAMRDRSGLNQDDWNASAAENTPNKPSNPFYRDSRVIISRDERRDRKEQ